MVATIHQCEANAGRAFHLDYRECLCVRKLSIHHHILQDMAPASNWPTLALKYNGHVLSAFGDAARSLSIVINLCDHLGLSTYIDRYGHNYWIRETTYTLNSRR